MASRIEDYAFISDRLPDRCPGWAKSRVDRLVVSAADQAGACFAALLGTNQNGRWQIAPTNPDARVQRRYREGTLILETEFHTNGGVVRVVDFMPQRYMNNGDRNPTVVRLVEGISGSVAMHMDLRIRFDYGWVTPWVRHDDGRHAQGGRRSGRSDAALADQAFRARTCTPKRTSPLVRETGFRSS